MTYVTSNYNTSYYITLNYPANSDTFVVYWCALSVASCISRSISSSSSSSSSNSNGRSSGSTSSNSSASALRPPSQKNPASHRLDNDYVLPYEFGNNFCVRIGARLGA